MLRRQGEAARNGCKDGDAAENYHDQDKNGVLFHQFPFNYDIKKSDWVFQCESGIGFALWVYPPEEMFSHDDPISSQGNEVE